MALLAVLAASSAYSHARAGVGSAGSISGDEEGVRLAPENQASGVSPSSSSSSSSSSRPKLGKEDRQQQQWMSLKARTNRGLTVSGSVVQEQQRILALIVSGNEGAESRKKGQDERTAQRQKRLAAKRAAVAARRLAMSARKRHQSAGPGGDGAEESDRISGELEWLAGDDDDGSEGHSAPTEVERVAAVVAAFDPLQYAGRVALLPQTMKAINPSCEGFSAWAGALSDVKVVAGDQTNAGGGGDDDDNDVIDVEDCFDDEMSDAGGLQQQQEEEQEEMQLQRHDSPVQENGDDEM